MGVLHRLKFKILFLSVCITLRIARFVDILAQLGGLRDHLVPVCGLIEHILLLIAILRLRIRGIKVPGLLRGGEYSWGSRQVRVISLSVN